MTPTESPVPAQGPAGNANSTVHREDLTKQIAELRRECERLRHEVTRVTQERDQARARASRLQDELNATISKAKNAAAGGAALGLLGGILAGRRFR